MAYIIIISVVAGALFLFAGGREMIGELLIRLFPKDYLKVGDMVDIYLNGEPNRRATITQIDESYFCIYNSVPLPIAYRGRFYATGICEDECGSRTIYVKNSKYYKFVRVAEAVRKAFNLIEDRDNLSYEDVAQIENEVAKTDNSEVESGQ